MSGGGGNFQRTPFVRSFNEAAKRKASAAIELLGYALPVEVVSRNGQQVEVKFELTNIPFTLQNVTIPILGSEYVRLPIKAGCKGVVFPFDASLGAVTGFGQSTVDLTRPANLTALAFWPIGTKNFPSVNSADELVLYGESGVLIESTKNKEWFAEWTTSGITVSNNDGSVSIAWNGTQWEVKGPMKCDSLLIANGGFQLNGDIVNVGGGTYTGNIRTTGTIQADTEVQKGSGASRVTLSQHVHSANNTPPTPGH